MAVATLGLTYLQRPGRILRGELLRHGDWGVSSTCPAIVDFIRHLVTNGGQFEKLLFAGGVFGGFGKQPIFGRLLPELI